MAIRVHPASLGPGRSKSALYSPTKGHSRTSQSLARYSLLTTHCSLLTTTHYYSLLTSSITWVTRSLGESTSNIFHCPSHFEWSFFRQASYNSLPIINSFLFMSPLSQSFPLSFSVLLRFNLILTKVPVCIFHQHLCISGETERRHKRPLHFLFSFTYHISPSQVAVL